MKVALIFTNFLRLLTCRTPSSPFKIRCWHHIPRLFFSFGCLKSEGLLQSTRHLVKSDSLMSDPAENAYLCNLFPTSRLKKNLAKVIVFLLGFYIL